MPLVSEAQWCTTQSSFIMKSADEEHVETGVNAERHGTHMMKTSHAMQAHSKITCNLNVRSFKYTSDAHKVQQLGLLAGCYMCTISILSQNSDMKNL